MIDKSAVIKNDNDEFSISICFDKSDKYLFLHAKTIDGSSEISNYTYNLGRSCESCCQNFIYSPIMLSSILDALIKRKLYGIIDSLSCGNGYSVMLLTRCNHDCIEISYPLLFFKTGKTEKCINENALMEFKRYVVTFYPISKLTPAATFEKTTCTPPH